MSCLSKKEETSKEALMSADDKSELRMVLLGKIGVGKSASGNTILGKENLFPSKFCLSATTSTCQKEMEDVDGRRVVVVDTPGLFQINRTNEEVLREIKKSIALATPHVFLIVLRVGDPYTDEEKKLVELICDTFGEKTLTYTMVLITHGSKLKEVSPDDFIRSNDDLFDLIRQCKWRYHVIDNKVQRDHQVTELLQKISDQVQQSKGSFYTTKMLKEAEIASDKRQVQKAQGGSDRSESHQSTLQTTALSGIGVGCLMGYLAGGGQVTSTVAAAVGGVVGGVLALVAAGLVILTRNRIKSCSSLKLTQ